MTLKFLNSFSIVIKRIIFKTNYLLKMEKKKQLEEYNNKYIRDLEYPVINDDENIWSDKDFIEKINNDLKNKFQIKNLKEIMGDGSLNNTIDNKLIKEIRNTFNENFNYIFSFFSDFFYSSNSEEEAKDNLNNINTNIKTMLISNDFNYDNSLRDYSNYINKINKKNREFKKLFNNSYIIENINSRFNSNNGQQKATDLKKKYLKINEFNYLIKCLIETKFKRDNSIVNTIIKKLRTNILNEQDPDSFIKYLFIDFFITTDKFSELSLKEIIYDYPKLYELYYFKILIEDLLYNECQINDLIDFRGNYISRTKGYKLRKFRYIRPHSSYGWIGIGIKLDENFIDNDEWVNSFYALGQNCSSEEIKKNLYKFLINGLENENLKNGFDSENNPLLNQNIINIENNCGIITFKNDSYRIALMVKIKKGIKNLKSDDFKVYTLLLKKINLNNY